MVKVKSTSCSSRGPGFKPHHLHGGSQPSVTPAPGHVTPSSGPFGKSMHRYIDIYAGETLMYIK